MGELVSAIIPSFNRAALLVRAFTSVAAQDYRPLEAVVVDDGSTDKTPELIAEQQRLLAHSGVELIYHRQPNAGPAAARNTGVALSHGGQLCFLDSDDYWDAQFISTLQRLLASNPPAGLAFCACTVVDEKERRIRERRSRLPSHPLEGILPRPFEAIFRYMPLSTPCVMVHRRVIDDVGVFDPAIRVGEDWDLWYRIAMKYDFVYTLRALSFFREHPENTPKFTADALAQRVRLIHKYYPLATEPLTHKVVGRRLHWEATLLQEQLMREGLGARKYLDLLEHPLSPRSLRFRLGGFIRRRPDWAQQAYARLIRALGSLGR